MPAPELCANLCEMGGSRAFGCAADVERAADDAIATSGTSPVRRIAVGSYVCDRLFCMLGDEHFGAVASFCSAHGVSATLVIPIFAQSTLEKGMRRTRELLARGIFDEVTVNDLGAATRLAGPCRELGLAMNWGRLMQRELRDARHADFASRERTCGLEASEVRDLSRRFPLGLVEFDPFAPTIDFSPLVDGYDAGEGATGETGVLGVTEASGVQGATGETGVPGATGVPGVTSAQGVPDASGEPDTPGTLGDLSAPGVPGASGEPDTPGALGAPYALHLPWCLETTGHICEAASAGRRIEESFRANAPCTGQCQLSHALIEDTASGTWHVKRGRSVWLQNPGCLPQGPPPRRLIWTAEV